MPYNPWYSISYRHILEMAKWDDLSADVARKIVLVFSWMPQTIMAVTHPGRTRKYEHYDASSLESAIEPMREWFSGITEKELTECDIAQYSEKLRSLCGALFPQLGSVASSKYLHFSAPKLLPMWDRALRVQHKHKDTVGGYLDYVANFRGELCNPENKRRALARYQDSAVRGWDIIRMENRSPTSHSTRSRVKRAPG